MATEKKIEVIIDFKGNILAWYSLEFEELVKRISTQSIDEREGAPGAIENFPFCPWHCG